MKPRAVQSNRNARASAPPSASSRRAGLLESLAVVAALASVSCDSLGSEPEAPPPAPSAPAAAPAPPVVPLPAPSIAAPGSTTIADVAAGATPSVVNVFATTIVRGESGPYAQDPFYRFFHGDSGSRKEERRARSLGSGVIVRADGTILTNNHVVQQADSIRVVLSDGREAPARVVGTDPPSDLAVIRIEGDVQGLRPIELGDSSRLRLGDLVLAIGNPFGVGQTVTMGIVSATGRADMGIVDYEDFVQTDAAINPGNSGGALVDMEGRLVGINTAILSRTGGYEGVGFAIPTNMARPIMESLLEHGRVVRGYLGVAIQDVDEEIAEALRLGSAEGVLVADVAAAGPAARAGIEPRDVILSVDGRTVQSSGQLRNLVAMKGADVDVDLVLVRNGERRNVRVRLAEMPSQDAPARAAPEPAAPSFGGLSLAPLDPAVRRRFDVPDELHGVVVAGVARGSAAEAAGIRPGDIVVEVNGAGIDSVGAFERAFAAARGHALVWVQRGTSRSYVVLPKR